MDPHPKRMKLSHSPDIYSQLRNLRKSQLLTDVTLNCGNVHVTAHRCVLAASSDYFRACLTTCMKESEANAVIKLPLVKDECLYDVINHIYGDPVDINECTVMIILDSANQLGLDDLKDKCCQFLNSSLAVDSCLQIHDVADLYSCFELSSVCKEYICRHFDTVRKHPSFLGISSERLVEYISGDSLAVDREINVFRAVETWIDHSPEARVHLLSELFPLIRTELVSSYEIAAVIHASKYAHKYDHNFLLQAYQYHALPVAARSHTPASKHRKDALRDCIFLIGGDNGIEDHFPFNWMKVLDVVTGQWITCTPVPQARSVSAIAVMSSMTCPHPSTSSTPTSCSTVTTTETTHSTSTCHTNDSESDGSSSGSCSESGRSRSNTRIIVAGGYDGSRASSAVYEYNLCQDEWKEIARLSQRRCSCSSVVYEGDVYCIGGVCGPVALVSVEVYNSSVGKWTPGPDIQESRSACGAVLIDIDGVRSIMVCGGITTGGDTIASCEVYSSTSKAWRYVTPMKTARRSFALCEYRGQVYAIGGNDGHSSIDSVEMYDPKTNTWSDVASLVESRMFCAAAVSNDKLYVVGGLDGETALSSTEVYDLCQDASTGRQKWNVIDPILDAPVCGAAVVTVLDVPYSYILGQQRVVEGGSDSVAMEEKVA